MRELHLHSKHWPMVTIDLRLFSMHDLRTVSWNRKQALGLTVSGHQLYRPRHTPHEAYQICGERYACLKNFALTFHLDILRRRMKNKKMNNIRQRNDALKLSFIVDDYETMYLRKTFSNFSLTCKIYEEEL